jgi:hypothetical protein
MQITGTFGADYGPQPGCRNAEPLRRFVDRRGNGMDELNRIGPTG